MQAQRQSGIVLIKKYSNRRLYDTQTSTYITLDDVRAMVSKNLEFEVRDAKTNEDLTRQILTQIIFEQELNGKDSMMPIKFLKNMITMYDSKMNEFLPYYLEGSMETFIANQEKIHDQFREIWGPYNPITQLEAMQKRNMELAQSAMQIFNPFDYLGNLKKAASMMTPSAPNTPSKTEEEE
jgi:polyhydroxyalkanoate synthesis repressor PhaR